MVQKMSNIGDVIDFIDNLTEETIDQNIADFKTDIAKAQGRIDVLEAIKRARQYITKPVAPAPVNCKTDEVCGDGFAIDKPSKIQPTNTPPTPKPKFPEREDRRTSQQENQAATIHTWLMANGRANVAKIYQHTSIHFRRVAKLLESHPAQFKHHQNGEWEAQ
jgi:hypothetical protein